MNRASWWNLANLLTISRIVLTPFAIREILLRRPVPALGWIMVASATDFFDGYFARHTATQSKFGQLLDPVADKILLSGVFVALATIRAVPLWYVVIVFGRDVLLMLTSAIALAVTKYRKLEPSIWGKGSTVLQILTAASVVAADASGRADLQAKALFLAWPSAILTVGSGVHYLLRGLYYLWRR